MTRRLVIEEGMGRYEGGYRGEVQTHKVFSNVGQCCVLPAHSSG